MSFLPGLRSVREKDLYAPKPEPPSFMAINRLVDDLADETRLQNQHAAWMDAQTVRTSSALIARNTDFLGEIAALMNTMPYGDMMEMQKGVEDAGLIEPVTDDLSVKLHRWAKARAGG